MASNKARKSNFKKSKESIAANFYNKYVNYGFLKSLFFDPNQLHIVTALILLAEFFLNIFVVNLVPYTEIDWIAYMQECEGFLNGEFNYTNLKGDTGPLVYPAGFLYVYSALYYMTSFGKNVRLAQYIFIGIYLIQLYLVLRLYRKSRKVPPYVIILSIFTSYRIHSIYVLRLFNDPIAILFAYAAINAFMDQKWTFGSFLFSIGVSIKMNILLFAPAIFLLYITCLGYYQTFRQLVVCALVQLILGGPFLMTYPIDYLKRSFDLGRQFDFKWTVNWRFLGAELFNSKLFHIELLICHISFLAIIASSSYHYLKSYCNLRALQKQLQPQLDRENIQIKARQKMKKKGDGGNNNQKKNENHEEELTGDQQKFLDSFEKTLKKSSGQSSNPNSEKEKSEEKSNETDSVSIQFDKAMQLALLPIFLCNFIGMACARSLHYQFYVWYFHSLPYLVWCTDYGVPFRLLLLGLLEFSWNTYPSTDVSSLLLNVTHVIIFCGVVRNMFKVIKTNAKVSEVAKKTE